MWKALIKLIEKWAYICDHDYEQFHKSHVYKPELSTKLPIRTEYIFRCTKCCKTKQISS